MQTARDLWRLERKLRADLARTGWREASPGTDLLEDSAPFPVA
ncbi:MAG: hypothetical protein K0S96_634 [Geminicoccaceae bacterium]|jgi:hypothetical protein|nr:hypothetical protein [Geminicoccaceae bacterium]